MHVVEANSPLMLQISDFVLCRRSIQMHSEYVSLMKGLSELCKLRIEQGLFYFRKSNIHTGQWTEASGFKCCTPIEYSTRVMCID